MEAKQPYFSDVFANTMLGLVDRNKEPLFLCIGTDRSTGDALGPLVGKGLKEAGFMVLGTLDEPVHAVNMCEVLESLKNIKKNRQVIAIDAGLGKNVGCVSVWRGSLQPGAGIRKELPEVGDIGIMGIVAGYSLNGINALQNVRLGMVVGMAEKIVMGVKGVYM